MSEAKKAAQMAVKSDDFRRLFNMPESETVIQDYRANFNGVGGRLYVSQNYVCFYSSLPLRCEIIPMKKIEAVTEESGFLWSGIGLTLNDKAKHIVSSFVGSHKEEAFTLLSYLWNNPPSYVQAPAASPQQQGGGSANPFGGGGGGRAFGGDPTGSFDQQDQQQVVKVDTSLAKLALRTANETLSMSAATIQELQTQAEQIDRIEGNVDRINARLTETDRLLRGIESLPAYIGNKFKNNKQKPPPIIDPPDRTIKVERTVKPMDIEILCKNKDDSFTPALIRLFKDSFMCIDPATGKLLQLDYAWNYDSIDSVVMRARHEHMDIRFHPPRERFRLMSSYLQVLTNEFILRGPKEKIRVIFEPGVKQFEYGNPKISVQPTASRAQATTGFVRNEARQKTADLLSPGADPQLVKDLNETDDALDQISDVLAELGDHAVATNQEIVRQTEQLDRINNKVDSTNARIRQQNRRMEDVMN